MRLLERRAAGVQVRRHATKRAEHRSKFDGRLGLERRESFAAGKRERRAPQAADRTRELPGSDTAQPQGSNSTDDRRKKYEYAQVIASESKRGFARAGGCGDDEIRLTRSIDRAKSEYGRRRTDGQRPAHGLFVADDEKPLDVIAEKVANGRQRREQRIARAMQLSTYVR